MSNFKKILIVCIAMVVVVGGFVVYHALNKQEGSEKYITEMILRGGGQSYEVRYNLDKGETLLISEKEREILSVLPRNPLEVLRLPNIKESKNTIEEKESISPLTFNSSLKESAKYINYLKKEGYEVIRQVHTPQYIDEVLEKGSSSKRVVIFRDSIMVGELKENSEFTQLDKYLKKYK